MQRGEINGLLPDNWANVIVAGPLHLPAIYSDKQPNWEDSLAFFDAIAPVVYTDTIDFEKAWYQSRYDKPGPGGTGKDYINCPMNRDEYSNFLELSSMERRQSLKNGRRIRPTLRAASQ